MSGRLLRRADDDLVYVTARQDGQAPLMQAHDGVVPAPAPGDDIVVVQAHNQVVAERLGLLQDLLPPLLDEEAAKGLPSEDGAVVVTRSIAGKRLTLCPWPQPES